MIVVRIVNGLYFICLFGLIGSDSLEFFVDIGLWFRLGLVIESVESFERGYLLVRGDGEVVFVFGCFLIIYSKFCIRIRLK